jgi:hypothetical protein
VEVMRVIVGFVLLILLGGGGYVRGEELIRTAANDAGDAGRVTWRLLRAPFSGRTNDYLMAGGILTGIAAASLLDRSVRASADSIDHQWAYAISDLGHAYQQTGLTFAVSATLYSAGLIAGQPALRRTGQEVVEAFCLSALGSQVVKRTLGRSRPAAEEGPYHFVGFNDNDAHESFPSGDAVKAFSLSAVLAAEAKSPPVTVLLFSLSGMTAFQRLHRDRHWFSDTVGAAAWGTAVGLAVVHAHQSLKNAAPRAAIVPAINGAGLVIDF